MKATSRASRRRLIVALTILAQVVGVGGAVALTGGGVQGNLTGGGVQSNVVALVNTKDGSTESKAQEQVAHDVTDVVDNGNAASVGASCTDCRTVAVAAQIVLVEGNPSVVTPTNVALVINNQCSGCESLAGAFQYVVSTQGVVHFTPEGEQEMNDINHQIETLIDSPISLFDMDAQLHQEIHELWDVVDTELVHAGVPFTATPHSKVEMSTTPAGADPSASPEASPSPSPTDPVSPGPTDPSPSPTVSTEPNPSSTDTANPSPAPSDTPAASASPSPTDSPSP